LVDGPADSRLVNGLARVVSEKTNPLDLVEGAPQLGWEQAGLNDKLAEDRDPTAVSFRHRWVQARRGGC
jgi:hypothetical protein